MNKNINRNFETKMNKNNEFKADIYNVIFKTILSLSSDVV